jgi:hypothetical protein
LYGNPFLAVASFQLKEGGNVSLLIEESPLLYWLYPVLPDNKAYARRKGVIIFFTMMSGMNAKLQNIGDE